MLCNQGVTAQFYDGLQVEYGKNRIQYRDFNVNWKLNENDMNMSAHMNMRLIMKIDMDMNVNLIMKTSIHNSCLL